MFCALSDNIFLYFKIHNTKHDIKINLSFNNTNNIHNNNSQFLNNSKTDLQCGIVYFYYYYLYIL